MASPSPAPPATRVDARRNRASLLAAARELLAAEGVDVSVREVARAAGVGVATLYRHFPTRDELVDAVLEDAFEDYVAIAEAALQEPDGWTGFRGFVEQTVELHTRNRGLRDVFEIRTRGRERARAMRRRSDTLIARLIERAQAEGTLRPDFEPEDLRLVLCSCDRALELDGAAGRRHLGFILDGLRRQEAT